MRLKFGCPSRTGPFSLLVTAGALALGCSGDDGPATLARNSIDTRAENDAQASSSPLPGESAGDRSTTAVRRHSPPPDAPKTLADIEQLAASAFDEHVEVEPLIYPKGWVKRTTPVLQSSHQTIEAENQTDGAADSRRGAIRLTFQQHCSVIHETKKQAEADDDLLPFPSAKTREEMETSRVHRRFEPVEVEIRYELKDGRWRRTGWTTTPKTSRGKSWLDRLGVP